jgi:hypothetical protein
VRGVTQGISPIWELRPNNILWWLMLRDTNSKGELADIEDANTCPQCNPDTYIGTAHSTRESQVRGGIDSESCDPGTQPSQQSYNAEEF